MSRIPRVPTAIVTAAALLTAGIAVFTFGRDASAAQDKPVIDLVSQKTTTGTAYRSAISSDGRTVAYQSNQGGNLRILLGDYTDRNPAELPSADTQAGTPSLSGDASLVSFLGDVAGGTQENPKDPEIYVVDRRDPAAPKVKQVTGGVNDLPYQRMVRCTINNGDADNEGCEPKLSRDGRTLVAPVDQSIDAPRLGLSVGDMDLHTSRGYAPMMDIFYAPGGRKSTLTVTNNGTLPIVYPETGPTVEGPGFTVADTTCANTLPSGGTCTVTVHSTGLGCGEESRGVLRLPATTSGGQTAISLLDHGDCPQLDALRPQPRAAAADCTGPSQYKWDLPVGDDPWASEGHFYPFFVVGAVDAGELGITAVNISNNTTTPQIPLLQSPGCQLKLVLPAAADPATSCHPNEPMAPQTSCTAYVEYQIPDVGPFLGTIDTGSLSYRITGHAARRAVAAWRDPGAAGNFGTAQLVSVTGAGNVPMDGTGPSVSADGRWIGYTSSTPLGWPEADPTFTPRHTQVFLHDTDADGNGTYKSGQTVLSSQRSDGELPSSASEASVSDDGARVAFSTDDEIGQVYVRDRVAGRTVLASSGPDGGAASQWSSKPQLSGDGYTVVYLSGASNLGVGDLAGPRIIARDLTSDFAGGKGTNELISVRPDGLGSRGGDGFPSVNQDGTEVAFWSMDLLHNDDQLNDDVPDPDVYHATRDSNATIAPDPLAFGSVPVGTSSGTKALTVTNTGLTAIQFAKPYGFDSDFVLAGDQCTGKPLRPEQSCAYLLEYRPTAVGPRSDNFYLSGNGVFLESEVTGRGTSDARSTGETSHVSTNDGRHLDPAISDNGQFVAYRTSADNTDAYPTEINVRDQATKQINGLGQHDRVGPPAISADGSRVAYNVVNGGHEGAVVSTKAGTHPVTGTSTDLRYQRPGYCGRRDVDNGSGNARERQCRPALSADGKTIAVPASLDPYSPALNLTVDAPEPVQLGSVLDFGQQSDTLTVTVGANRAVQFSGPPVIDPKSAFSIAATTCTGAVAAEGTCTIDVSYSACSGGQSTAILRLDGTTPDAQTAINLIGNGGCLKVAAKSTPRAAACTPIPAPTSAPYLSSGQTNAHNPLAQYGVPVGEVTYLGLAVVPQAAEQTIYYDSGCDFELVQPTTPDPNRPKPCVDGEKLPANTGCTAYVGFRAGAVDVSIAELVTYGNEGPQFYRFSGSGYQDVVVTRADTAGDGTYAGAPQIASRNDAGDVIDGVEPSLSADGRYLAFSSAAAVDRPADGYSDQVYRRDLRDGKTVLVSQLADGEVGADSAFAASLSADGSRVAFATDGYENAGLAARSESAAPHGRAVPRAASPIYHPSQVWARDIPSGKTVLVSAVAGKPSTAGKDWSWDPSISDDGATVGFTSDSDDLVTDPGNRDTAVFVRELGPDFTGQGERFSERVSLTAEGAVPENGRSITSSLSSDGAFTAFASDSQLVTTDTDDNFDIYVRRRPAQLVIEPASVDFGAVQLGKTSSARELVVRNLGPGAAAAGPTKVDPPFAAGTGVCKVTLHRGETCTVDARFVPVAAGPVNGLLTLPSVQGYLPGPSVSAGLTGTGTAVPPVAGFTVVPGKLAFGSSEVGKAGPASKVTLRNTGQVALSVAAGLTSAGDFGVDNSACTTLMPGASCDYPVNFVARKAGTRVGSILFRPSSQDPLVKSPGSVTVGLSGVGVGKPGAAVASMTVAPKVLSFGTQILTTASAPQAVVVTNTGNVPLNISGLTAARDFTAATAVACRGLLPGRACQVAVRFVPQAVGTQAGGVLVTATAVGAAAPFPSLVRMSGATAVPTLVLEPPVVRPGQIVLATGTNFPPGQASVLAWKTGLGTQKVVADQTGRFQNAVLVFRRDVLGQRFLEAAMPAQSVPVQSPPVLVMPLGPQPPNFVLRW